MALHNGILYNEALNSYIQAQGPIPTPYNVDGYSGVVTAAEAVAAAIDAEIANDSLISSGDGAVLAASSISICGNQNAKKGAVRALVLAQFTGQSIDPANTTGLAAWATNAAVLYAQMVAAFLLPAT